ncbi:TPA: DUF4352 domain-containing protein [Candidatus Woesearchaeota archaeon]|nr:DUF4352 domain-containing protein [Candidatus Woesearchaeota archaeon]
MAGETKVKRITAGLIFSWIFGVLFVFGGIGVIGAGSYLLGILIVLCAALIIPTTNTYTSEKFHFEVSGGIKWILAILILIFMVVGMSHSNVSKDGISPINNNADAQQAVAPSNAAATAKLYGLGDRFVAGDFTWTITDVTTTSQIGQDLGGTFFGEKASGIFVVLDVEVENTGNKADYLSDSYIQLIDDQGREFSPTTMAAVYLKPEGSALVFEQLNPGITKTGKIVYDVPKGLKVANVKVQSSLLTSEYYTVRINIP